MREYWHLLTPWQKFKFVCTLLLFIYVILFAIFNWESQTINFIFFPVKLPLTLIILICLTVGYLSSMLFDYKKYKAKEIEIKQLKDQIETLKTEENKPLSE